MRNLKRVLSLVLALMMTFSLMVFTTSASAAQATIPLASEMYSDYDNVKDEYKEAIDVMTAIEVVDGTGEGDAKKLNPTEELTRAEATAILARLLLTPAQAANFNGVSATTQFTDVQYDHWAASYIAYCANQGIVSGHSPTEFDPNGQLTGVAFGKMLLVALGYNAENEGYTGNNWTTNVAVGLINAGIIVDDLDLSKPLTREGAMEMAFQALQAPLVEYAGNITVGGTTVNFGSGKANYVTSTLAREQRINNRTLTNSNGYTVEFAEKYFPSLWLFGSQTSSDGSSTYRTDAFGRPAHTWTYKNVDINDPYLDEELFVDEWTGGVSGAEISKVLNYSAVSNYNLEVYVDGATVNAGDVNTKDSIRYQLKNNSKDALYLGNKDNALTGNGVLTQVYVDHDPIYAVNNVGTGAVGTGKLTGNISIVIINTYLAQVTSTSKVNVYYDANDVTDGNERNVFASKDAAVSNYTKGDKVKVLVADPDHGDYVGPKDIDNSRYKVQEVSDAKVVSDVKITSYSLNNIDTVENSESSYMKTVVADGETYSASKKAFYDANVLYNYNQDREELKSATFAIYLDDYGFALGVEEMEAANNYVFVVGWAHGENVLGYKGDRALIITVDGTMKAVSATAENLKKWNGNAWVADTHLTTSGYSNPAENTWYTYSMDGDTYVLEREVRNQGVMAVADRNAGEKKADISNTYTSLKKNNSYDTVGGTYAYGNDNSKYIVVTADVAVNSGGSITKIDRVVTGIANTNINVPMLMTTGDSSSDTETVKNGFDRFVTSFRGAGVHTTANVAADTYFLYDNNNYVTYAVVVGGVVANSEDMIYFTGGVTQRSINGQIYDRYNVIRNGELTTVDVLESVANDENGGKGPQEGELYIAGFDSDGRVIALEKKSAPTISTDDSEDLNETERYVLVTDSGKKLNIREVGNTIWVAKDTTDVGYIRLATNCAVFLNNKATTLEKALEDTIKDGKEGFLGAGQVVAICDKNGNATALILTSKATATTPAPVNPGNTPSDDALYNASKNGNTISMTYDPNEIEAAAAYAKTWLEGQGYSDVQPTVAEDGKISLTATKNGITMTFKVVNTVSGNTYTPIAGTDEIDITTLPSSVTKIEIPEDATVTIVGNLTKEVEAKAGATVTIEGNVAGTIDATADGVTINVEGDIASTADITADALTKFNVTGEWNAPVKVNVTSSNVGGGGSSTSGIRAAAGFRLVQYTSASWENVTEDSYAKEAWKPLFIHWGPRNATNANGVNSYGVMVTISDENDNVVFQMVSRLGIATINTQPLNTAGYYFSADSSLTSGDTYKFSVNVLTESVENADGSSEYAGTLGDTLMSGSFEAP